MSEPTVWARAILQIAEYAGRFGADRARVLARSGLDPASAADPDARVPVGAFYAAIEAAAEATGDEFFGVSYIDAVEPSSIDAVGFLAMASRTMGEALERIIRHHPMMTEGEVFSLEVVGDRAVFRYVPFGSPRLAHAHCAEMYAADCLILTPRITGAPVDVRSFRLTHARRGTEADYLRRFGAVPEFESDANEWILGAEVLDRPMPNADPGLAAFFERYLEPRRRQAGDPTPWRERVRRTLSEALAERAISIDDVAQALRISTRTLQRRLAAEGASLDSILEELRRSRAEVYLDLGLPVAEASYLLGYAEPSVFHRAFKRWTGQTPREWRDRRGDSRSQKRL